MKLFAWIIRRTLSQIRLYKGEGLLESHKLALLLQLSNGHYWRRDTGIGEEYVTTTTIRI